VPGSGAEDARLQAGDVIVEIDGEAVTTSDDVRAKVRGHEVGDRIEITIERDGERQVLRATLGSTTD
jgi:S1-C subfamily serine protease